MAKRAVEHMFTGSTTPLTSYDSSLTNLGSLIVQKTGGTAVEKFAGPIPVSVARPMEASTAIACQYPHVLEFAPDEHWVFLADLTTAASTRRVVLYKFTPSTQAWSWRGFITLTYPAATAHTIRGLRVVRHTHSAGTVQVTGTALTGTGTLFTTNRLAAGGRIGFGTTDPTQVTTWYYVSAIGSETGMTLTASTTVPGGTSYVYEEFRIYTSTTNATTTNGGLFVAKGVNYDDFVPGGTTINAATTTDNLKAVYWLADASTVLNTIAAGLSIGSATPTNTNTDLYVLNAESGTTVRIYKYNGRAALSGLASGKSTSAFVLRTGVQTTTGTTSQTNTHRIATLGHGPGSGQSNLYFATTTRIYRCPESGIIDASTTFISDAMLEIPPGSANTFAATSAMTSVEYAASIDRLIITTGAASRTYLTQYNSTSSPLDKVMFCNNNQIDQSTANSGLAAYPSSLSGGFSVWSEAGICYLARTGTTAAINLLYAFPLGADWDFASSTNQRLVSPEISTPNCSHYSKLGVFHEGMIGSDNLGIALEPFRAYYRTSGISDNSGSWTLISETGDLSSIAGASSIQIMFEFKVASNFCLPARIFGFVISYEDTATDSHYQPSVQHSSTTAKRFGWRFATAFGGTVPTLTIRLYDAVTDSLLLTDTTAAAANGTWEKSTNDGGAWGSYNTTDKANETTYIRYTPTSLADNIKVRAILTQ